MQTTYNNSNRGKDLDPRDMAYVPGKPRLYKVPKAVIQAADQKLFEKVTSGEKFITPFDNFERSMKYCDYKPGIQTARILSIE